jgi:hypothetical protein
MRSVLKSVIGNIRIQSSSSWSSYWTPRNVVVVAITGGIRITWTPSLTDETEIWLSIGGGTPILITTLPPNTSSYDYTDASGFDLVFSLRFKLDTTVLNVPSSLTTTELVGQGATISWNDNNTEADHVEIWANIANGGYALLTTVLTGVQSYVHLTEELTNIKYKIRAKEGTLPVYSAFSSVSEITTSDRKILIDTFTAADNTDLSAHTPDVGAGVWSIGNGSWKINGNMVQQLTAGSAYYYAIKDAGKVNIDISADIKVITDNQSTGLTFRYVDISNKWKCHILKTAGDAVIYISKNNDVPYGSYPINVVVGSVYNLRVKTIGDTINVYWDHATDPCLVVVSDIYNTATNVGLTEYVDATYKTAFMDNFILR